MDLLLLLLFSMTKSWINNSRYMRTYKCIYKSIEIYIIIYEFIYNLYNN